MIKTQFTVAFHEPISVQELHRILSTHYGKQNVEVGEGILVNGLPHDWIVVSNE
jgi:hypothetical protein